jgi:ABC-type lipoprotein export system ATPase subunit
MDIHFNHVLPTPLSSIHPNENLLWNNNVILQQGKKVVVEAPSGRGKSTLIHLLFGLRKDYTGEILLDGQLISNFSKATWSAYRKDKIAIVFQDLQLFPQLTLLENLYLKNNLTNHLTQAELLAFIAQVGLSEKLNEKCGNLSMGQQQRVAIIRAICQPFSWLLLDEPFSHLDAKNAEICMAIINQVCEKQHAGWVLTALGKHVTSSFDQLIFI